MKREVMNEEELHEYGINVMISYLKQHDYTIVETNYGLDTSPQIIAQDSHDMYFILVATFMYPKKTVVFSPDTISFLKESSKKYGAKCMQARVGLAYADAKNAKEIGMPYKDADFLVKFAGLEEI